MLPTRVAQYGYHLPLYRIEQLFASQGVTLARPPLCGWIMQCGLALMPWVLRLRELLKQPPVIFSDDTPVQLQVPGQARQTRFWVYTGHSPPIIVYDYTDSRAGKPPRAQLEGDRGYLQADA